MDGERLNEKDKRQKLTLSYDALNQNQNVKRSGRRHNHN